jgi:N-acetylmuramoyl-L-alanine amidase
MNGYTLVPLLELSRAMQAQLVHNRITMEYIVILDQNRMVFVPSDKVVEFNNGTIQLPVITAEIRGRVYVPLVFVLEKFGFTLDEKTSDYRFSRIAPSPVEKVANTPPKLISKDEERTLLPADIKLDEATPIPVEDEQKETQKIEEALPKVHPAAKVAKTPEPITAPLPSLPALPKKILWKPAPEVPKPKGPSSLKGKTIAIIAGHGGLDPGAIGPRGTLEKDVTLPTAQKLQQALEKLGVKVVMVREKDEFMSLRQRVDLSNKTGADATISIHFNASEWPQMLGVETYYYKQQDYALAMKIHPRMVESLQRPDRAVRRARFYELNHTSMPCILVEPAYISNRWEEMLILNASFRDKIVEGIIAGFEDYFEKQ